MNPPQDETPLPAHYAAWDAGRREAYLSRRAEEQAARSVSGGGVPEASGRWVVVDSERRGLLFAEAGKGRTARMGKKGIKTDKMLGAAYGSVFRQDGDSFQPAREEAPAAARGRNATQYNDPSFVPTGNNSEFFDTGNDNQKLSAEDIEKLKEKGVGGADLVRTVTASNANFKRKTEFSQEKYLARKKAKHVNSLVLRRATPERVCLALTKVANGRKVMNIRPDVLAAMLTRANVQAGVPTMVVDSASGVVAAAVAEAMGGHGHVLVGTPVGGFSCEGLKKCDLLPRVRETIVEFPLRLLGELRRGVAPAESLLPRAAHHYAKARELVAAKACSAIIASKYEPLTVLKAVLPHLESSSPVVVYAEEPGALAECHAYLKLNDLAVNVQLSENFYRVHQVLPNRTHPLVRMSWTSGYVLSATYIAPPEPSPPAVSAPPASSA